MRDVRCKSLSHLTSHISHLTMNLLALETSTETGSVAWLEDGRCVAEIIFRRKNSHSEVLATAMQDVAALAGHTLAEAEALALSGGPGSYTGLRIGASTAKGFCAGLGIPLYPIDTLAALAWAASAHARLLGGVLIAPMLDARRMEVYTALYREDGTCLRPSAPVILDESFLEDDAEDGPILAVGNGVPKLIELLAHTGRFVFLPEAEPLARAVGELAYLEMQLKNEPVDLIRYEPNYLKPFMGTKPKAQV